MAYFISQSNLFDPDVIFSPVMMSESGSVRSRPSSASTKHSQSTTSLKVRPKSAGKHPIFIRVTVCKI